PRLEGLGSEIDVAEVLRPTCPRDVHTRRGEGVAVVAGARGDAEGVPQTRRAERVEESGRYRAQERERRARGAPAEREDDVGHELQVHPGYWFITRGGPPRAVAYFA